MNYCSFCFITENPSIDIYINNCACEQRYIYYKCRKLIKESWNTYKICSGCMKYLDNSCLYCKISLNETNKCKNCDNIFDGNTCIDHCGCC